MSQELPGRGLGFPRLGWLGPWWAGVVGEGAPPPRLARLLGLRQLVVGVCWCPYCVRLCMMCSSVPQFPSPAPPNYPPTVYLYWGTGCLVFCAMARAKTFVFAHSGGTCALALCSGRREKCGEGGGASWVICWATGRGEKGRLPLASRNLFSVCLSLFFPFALSVSSLLIRSPNPPLRLKKQTLRYLGRQGLHP